MTSLLSATLARVENSRDVHCTHGLTYGDRQAQDDVHQTPNGCDRVSPDRRGIPRRDDGRPAGGYPPPGPGEDGAGGNGEAVSSDHRAEDGWEVRIEELDSE